MNEATSEATAEQVLNREFFEIRAKLLEIAASLDRLRRAGGDLSQDVRMSQVQQAIQLLHESPHNDDSLAAAIQLNFSLPFNKTWQSDFGLS